MTARRPLRGRAAGRSCSAPARCAGCSGDTTAESTTTDRRARVGRVDHDHDRGAAVGRQAGSFYVPAVGDCFDIRPVDRAPADPPGARLLAPPPAPGVRDVRLHRPQGLPRPGRAGDPGQAAVPEVMGGASSGRPTRRRGFEMAFDLPDQAGWGNGIRHVVGCLVVDPKGDSSPARSRASPSSIDPTDARTVLASVRPRSD